MGQVDRHRGVRSLRPSVLHSTTQKVAHTGDTGTDTVTDIDIGTGTQIDTETDTGRNSGLNRL